MLVSSFNLSQSFNYTPYLFSKKWFKSEINSFCIWTLDVEDSSLSFTDGNGFGPPTWRNKIRVIAICELYSAGIYRPCFGHEKAPIPKSGSQHWSELGESCAGNYKPCFGHENLNFRFHSKPSSETSVSALGGSLSVKTLWGGSFHFLLQNEGIG
jgi:hypothetical protein